MLHDYLDFLDKLEKNVENLILRNNLENSFTVIKE